MKRLFAVALVAASAAAGTASAAPITFGAVTVDTDNSITTAVVTQTSPFGVVENDVVNPFDVTFGVGESLFPILDAGLDEESTLENGVEMDDFQNVFDVIEVGFGPGGVFNGPGFDIFIVERFNDPDPMAVSLTSDFAEFVIATLVAPDPLTDLDWEDGIQFPDFFDDDKFFLFAIDLSDLGLPEGFVFDTFFIRAIATADYDSPGLRNTFPPGYPDPDELNGDIDIAGIFARDVPPVPVPAAMPLFLAGLAGLAFAQRRRRKA